MSHRRAMAVRIVFSMARRLTTGRTPGMPRHTGQTWVLGGAPNTVEHPQKILVAVLSSACTSNPMTGSYVAMAPNKGRAAAHGNREVGGGVAGAGGTD